jgi:hypothetical protein
MDKTVRRYTSLAAMKADEYRAWHKESAQSRLAAVSEMAASAFAIEGQTFDVPRLHRTFVRLQRP